MYDCRRHVVCIVNRPGLYRRYLPTRDLYELDRHMRVLMRANPEIDIAQYYASPLSDLKYVSTISYLQDWFELRRPLPPLNTLTLPVLVLLSKGGQLSDMDKLMQRLTALPQSDVKKIRCEPPVANRDAASVTRDD